MSGTWGNKVRYSIFGESHGEAIGIVIDGLPAGFVIDFNEVSLEMQRRAPGKSKLTTSRKEGDEFNIVSGYFQGKTTGTPLTMFIKNSNTISKDYSELKDLMRPGHGDYTGRVKYEGNNDYRGGGHFSGRLTAPLVFAGSIAKQILREKHIEIGSHISSIGHIFDEEFNKLSIEEKQLVSLRQSSFPVLSEEKSRAMKAAIEEVKSKGDSIGGSVEAAILNVPAGLGEPFFNSIESTLSQLLFSIPGVKAVEFGEGHNISTLKGSEAKDEYYIQEGKVKTYSNNNGGILGGISTAMPIVFKVYFKPTPSISMRQRTVDMARFENSILDIKGRHDPCIVVRALPVVEAVAAMGILEFVL